MTRTWKSYSSPTVNIRSISGISSIFTIFMIAWLSAISMQSLEHLGYGASDFILMPSSFEPCGLPQMIAPIYGSLPVAHDTGGIHDTITHLDVDADTGNGFLFKHHDAGGLYWAIEEAMRFYNLDPKTKAAQIQRIMNQSLDSFNHSVTAASIFRTLRKNAPASVGLRPTWNPMTIP